MDYTTSQPIEGNPEPIPLKACTKCSRSFPATPEFWKFKKGLPSLPCRECHKAYSKARHARQQPVEYPTIAEKRCSRCHEIKPAYEFYTSKKSKDGLANNCKECAKVYAREWGETNHERKINNCQHWREENVEHRRTYKIANRERELAQKRIRYHTDPDKQRVLRKKYYNSEKAVKAVTRWQQEHQDYLEQYHASEHYKLLRRIRAHKRRAYKRASIGQHTEVDVLRQYRLQNGKCWWCGKKLEKYHIDHSIPLVKGGSNGPENIILSCPHCNLSKGAKLPQEFCGRLF